MGYFTDLYKIYPPKKLNTRKDSVFNKEKTVSVLEKEQFDLFEFYDLLKNNKLTYQCSAFERIILNSYFNGETIDVEIKKNISELVLEKYYNDKQKFLYTLLKNSESARNLGNSFQDYIKQTKYYKELSDNLLTDNSIWITTSIDKNLTSFVNEHFGLKLEKGIDAIAKTKNGKILIIEAKLITNSGGAQNLQLENAIKVAKIKNDKVQGIALVDGIVYNSKYKPVHWLEKDFNFLKKENKLFSATKLIQYLSEN